MPPTARAVASLQLAAHASRFPDLIPLPLETAHLDDRDAALAHAIEDAAIRRWLTLSALLDRVLKQPFHTLQPDLRGVLLAGAAQLLLMDRIPAHAALNESVDLAKRLVGRGGGGLANAVLRRISEMRSGPREPVPWSGERSRLPMPDGSTLPLSGDLLPESETERLAAATSHSPWLIARWQRDHPDSWRSLALHSLLAPPTILHSQHARAPLPETCIPHEQPGHHVFNGTHAELGALLASRADLWVQDPASSRAVSSAAHLRPGLVIDACAGQGTKTRQLAAVFPGARIIATDIDPARYNILQAQYPPGGRTAVVPPADLPAFAGQADLILLDVPCGNSGVLARRPEAKYRAGNSQLKRLNNIQRQIIADAIPLLRDNPRGKLLYSTCSIEPEENRAIAQWAVKWHRFTNEHELLTLPASTPGDAPARYHDGSYSAILG